MRKWCRLLGVVLAAGLLVGISFSGVVFAEVTVDISPQTLNLVEFGAEEVTVHISIPYDGEATVMMECDLDTIKAFYTFADNRGELVAKFSLEDVASIVEEGENILALLVDDVKMGFDTIQVISGGMKNGE